MPPPYGPPPCRLLACSGVPWLACRLSVDDDHLVFVRGRWDPGVELGVHDRQLASMARRGGWHLEQVAGDHLRHRSAGEIGAQIDDRDPVVEVLDGPDATGTQHEAV